MTSRVGHSLGAMRRLMQLSRNRVFIYVEGRDLDPYFYGCICGPICNQHGLRYEIIVADRISGGGGGKSIIIRLFEYLRGKGALLDRTGPVSKLAMFYVDKDTDDVFRCRRKSGHIVYTTHYCAENHLFCDGDLCAGIAAAGSVDLGIVRARITDPAQWRRISAVQWRDWIVLCLAAHKLRLRGPVSYSANHSSTISAVNPANLIMCRADLQTRSGLPVTDFNRILRWAEALVDRSIHLGTHDRLFKGKWYVYFVLYELDQIERAHHSPINRNGAKDRLMGSLSATVPFNDTWAERYKEPLQLAIEAL